MMKLILFYCVICVFFNCGCGQPPVEDVPIVEELKKVGFILPKEYKVLYYYLENDPRDRLIYQELVFFSKEKFDCSKNWSPKLDCSDSTLIVDIINKRILWGNTCNDDYYIKQDELIKDESSYVRPDDRTNFRASFVETLRGFYLRLTIFKRERPLI